MNLYSKIEYQIRDYKIHLNTTFYKYKRKCIKAHWYRVNNFGDWLTPVILEHYGFTVIYSNAYDADIIMAGSILERVPHLYKGIILGTGYINSKSELTFPNAKILGLRGTFSKNNTFINENIILGDPGLLISLLINKQSKKKYKLGVVPHLNDKYTRAITLLHKRKYVKVIDPQQHPIRVAREVSSCEAILSSSLHGLIFADSFGIPNKRLILSGKLAGGNFKFEDYYSALEYEESPIIDLTGNEDLESLIESSTRKNQKKINNIKNNLDTLLRNLSL